MRSIITVFVLAACGTNGGGGGDDVAGVPPKLIAGGGIADAPLDGTLHVHVVEVDSSAPLSGAAVRVETAPEPLTGTTDATGLVTFDDPRMSGPQTITVTAGGHAAATWIGVAGANVTIPLEPPTRTVPTAHVTGTIAGWNNLPAPALGNYNLGLVLYSFLDDPGAPENSIAQPTSGGTPLDTCIRSALSNNCAWEMNARVGTQVHFAVIVEGDPQGTNSDTSDDTYTLIGYAVSQPMTLTAGQQVTGESLAIVSGTMPLPVTLPAAPAGLPHVIAVPELALGDAGRIVFPLPTLTTSGTASVLAPTGQFAGHYEVVALATPSATAKAPFSSAFAHDVTGSATIGPWIGAPSQLSAGAMFGFTPAPGAAFHTAQLTKGTSVLWDVTVVDGTTSFKLPALSPDPLGTGTITFAVNAADVPSFDAKSFDVPSVKTAMARASGAQTTFTH